MIECYETYDQVDRYKLWQKTISRFMFSLAASTFAYKSLDPKMRQTLLILPSNIDSLIMVLTTVPSGALLSCFA